MTSDCIVSRQRRGSGRATRRQSRAIPRSVVNGERAAVVSVSHDLRVQHVIAGRRGAAVHPAQPVAECGNDFGTGKVAVPGCADSALYQQTVGATVERALTVKLLVAKGHVKIPERVQRQYRYVEFTLDQGQPAHTVLAQRVDIF